MSLFQDQLQITKLADFVYMLSLSLLIKLYCWPDEMASRTEYGERTVVSKVEIALLDQNSHGAVSAKKIFLGNVSEIE